ncbi:MAG: phosphatidylglycerol lysyltransferase domain-containing protein [Gemmatimonadaceae bacterium]
MARTFRSAGRVVTAAAPLWFSASTFVAGGVLLVSGATPSIHARMRWLDAVLPLGVMEVSHFVASLAGLGLLFLANGLRRRLDAAYHATIAVLVVGIATSLLKGADWEEALLLSLVLMALWPPAATSTGARRCWPNPSHRRGCPPSLWLSVAPCGWGSSASSMWTTRVTCGGSSKPPPTPRDSCARPSASPWRPACGRLARLLRPAHAEPDLPTAEDLARAKRIAQSARASDAHLALTGDKALLFSESGRSFIQYGVMKRSWVAAGDPVGDPTEFSELAWQFTALADRHGAWPVFYQVARALADLHRPRADPVEAGRRARVHWRSSRSMGATARGCGAS